MRTSQLRPPCGVHALVGTNFLRPSILLRVNELNYDYYPRAAAHFRAPNPKVFVPPQPGAPLSPDEADLRIAQLQKEYEDSRFRLMSGKHHATQLVFYPTHLIATATMKYGTSWYWAYMILSWGIFAYIFFNIVPKESFPWAVEHIRAMTAAGVPLIEYVGDLLENKISTMFLDPMCPNPKFAMANLSAPERVDRRPGARFFITACLVSPLFPLRYGFVTAVFLVIRRLRGRMHAPQRTRVYRPEYINPNH